MRKIEIIDLLCLISNDEELPKKIKYGDNIYILNENIEYYGSWECDGLDLLNDILLGHYSIEDILNYEIEILDDEEDKDIPLITDDELWNIDNKKGIMKDGETTYGLSRDVALNYNFKVLKEKINQVVEELNKRQ